MTEKLNPEALAQMDDDDLREGIQVVTRQMILDYVLYEHELPQVSAEPFSAYLHQSWFDWGTEDTTNGQVITGALAYWRGV